jgi:predicted anti-sigma-YlaC factor YlaD
MTCNESEHLISRLIDGELHSTLSAPLFNHLGECDSCREFLCHTQQIDIRIRRSIVETLGDRSGVSERRSRYAGNSPLPVWNRQVSLSLRSFALAGLCVLLIIFVLYTREDRVYVTSFSPVVTTAER